MEETKTIEISQKVSSLVTTLLMILSIFMLGELLYRFQSLPQNAGHEISVTGEGKAYIKPNVALVNLGMHTQADKSQDAVNQNNKVMDAAVKAIKALGVEDKDIQTIMYSLMPMYDYTESGRVFRGYSLDQQVSIKIRNFDNINDILDKAATSGLNTIDDLQFTVDDMEKTKAEARAKAIAQAKEKALTLAKQSGLRIVKLVNISEEYSPTPIPMYARADGMMIKESVVPQIQTGQMEINSTITLTYRIR